MTTLPKPIIHTSIIGARMYYLLRRRGVPSDVAHERTRVVSHLAYWDTQRVSAYCPRGSA